MLSHSTLQIVYRSLCSLLQWSSFTKTPCFRVTVSVSAGCHGCPSSSSSNSDPESSLQPKTEDDTGDSSEHTDDSSEHSADWKETREPASGSNALKNTQESVSDPRRSAEKKPFSCSVCEEAFRYRRDLNPHRRETLWPLSLWEICEFFTEYTFIYL